MHLGSANSNYICYVGRYLKMNNSKGLSSIRLEIKNVFIVTYYSYKSQSTLVWASCAQVEWLRHSMLLL